jgi:acyl carrier protein
MPREEHREDLLRLLRTIQRPDRAIEDLAEGEDLVKVGLVDSLAVLQIVQHLEATYKIDFLDKGLDTAELSSVASILDLIERET